LELSNGMDVTQSIANTTTQIIKEVVMRRTKLTIVESTIEVDQCSSMGFISIPSVDDKGSLFSDRRKNYTVVHPHQIDMLGFFTEPCHLNSTKTGHCQKRSSKDDNYDNVKKKIAIVNTTAINGTVNNLPTLTLT